MPEALEIGEEAQHARQALAPLGVLAVHGHPQVLLDGKRREDPLPLGDEAHPEPGHVIGRSMALPSKRIAPWAGWRSPMMLRMVVVLPAPLRPSSTVTASRLTRSDTPWRMWCWPM